MLSKFQSSFHGINLSPPPTPLETFQVFFQAKDLHSLFGDSHFYEVQGSKGESVLARGRSGTSRRHRVAFPVCKFGSCHCRLTVQKTATSDLDIPRMNWRVHSVSEDIEIINLSPESFTLNTAIAFIALAAARNVIFVRSLDFSKTLLIFQESSLSRNYGRHHPGIYHSDWGH